MRSSAGTACRATRRSGCPGEDHAGIATQNVIERELAKEGLTRHDLGREAFVERTWMWVRKYRSRIADQHRKLGASADWSRNTFTLDPGIVKAVRTTFVNLYKQGLIYRGLRMINWCPNHETALSDLEVDYEESPRSSTTSATRSSAKAACRSPTTSSSRRRGPRRWSATRAWR